MTNSAVSLKRCGSYEPTEVYDSLKGCLEPLGGIEAFVKPGERILLKPNLVTTPQPQSPACTHHAVVMAMGRLIMEAGGAPTIGDSPAFGSTRRVAWKVGMLQAAEAHGIPLVNLGGTTFRSVSLNGRKFTLPVSREALQYDGIINIPKFKSHRQATLSFGIKNLYGCVPGKTKALRHFVSSGDMEWFCDMLVANAAILAPRLSIVDGVVAMEGLGPVKGSPRPLNVLLAGADLTALDMACCRVVGYPPKNLYTNRAAIRLGFGECDPDQVALLGDPLEGFVVSDFHFAEEIPIFFSLPQLVRSCLRSWREKLSPQQG